jgi:hypothetical protein
VRGFGGELLSSRHDTVDGLGPHKKCVLAVHTFRVCQVEVSLRTAGMSIM